MDKKEEDDMVITALVGVLLIIVGFKMLEAAFGGNKQNNNQ